MNVATEIHANVYRSKDATHQDHVTLRPYPFQAGAIDISDHEKELAGACVFWTEFQDSSISIRSSKLTDIYKGCKTVKHLRTTAATSVRGAGPSIASNTFIFVLCEITNTNSKSLDVLIKNRKGLCTLVFPNSQSAYCWVCQFSVYDNHVFVDPYSAHVAYTKFDICPVNVDRLVAAHRTVITVETGSDRNRFEKGVIQRLHRDDVASVACIAIRIDPVTVVELPDVFIVDKNIHSSIDQWIGELCINTASQFGNSVLAGVFAALVNACRQRDQMYDTASVYRSISTSKAFEDNVRRCLSAVVDVLVTRQPKRQRVPP